MASNFPSSQDSFGTAPTASSPRSSPSLSGLIGKLIDAVTAVQAKLGINGDTSPTSIDYLLKNTSGGHSHNASDSRAVQWTSIASKPSTFSPSTHAHADHTGIGANDHHAEVHGPAKHTASGAVALAPGQSVANNTAAAMDLTSAAWDSASYVDAAANRLNVPANGYYRVTARAQFAQDNSGRRRLKILVDGTEVDADQRAAVDSDYATALCSWTGALTTANKVSAEVYHNAGRTLSVSGSLTIEFLGTA